MSSSDGPKIRKLNGDARSMSSTLLGRLREREPAAWERLCQVYGPLVYAWCRRAGLGAEDSADTFQEVFQALAGAIESFRRERPGDSFTAWLATVTRNKIRDFFRRQSKTPQAAGGTDHFQWIENVADSVGALDDGDSSVTDADETNILHRTVQSLRAEFEDRTWQAFWQTTVDGRRPADVAADLGVTPSAVYTAKSRVLRRLRDELDGML